MIANNLRRLQRHLCELVGGIHGYEMKSSTWSVPRQCAPTVSHFSGMLCCRSCRRVARPVKRVLEASLFSQFWPTLCPTRISQWSKPARAPRCAVIYAAPIWVTKSDFEKDRVRLQRSSNKLSPTPRLHTRMWEWTISVVGEEWAVRFHSPRNSTRKERRAVERKCRAADWLGQKQRHPAQAASLTLVCSKLRSRAPRRTGDNVGERIKDPVSAGGIGRTLPAISMWLGDAVLGRV